MLKRLIFLASFLNFMYCFTSSAQTHRVCLTHEHDEYLKSTDADYARKRTETEAKISAFIASHPDQRISGAPVIIPVVVHIVYNTPGQNISNEQVISQMDVLNEDYAASNANIAQVPSVWVNLVGDDNVRYSLAQRDTIGNPTSGIIRTPTSKTFFNTNDNVKFDSMGGSNAWDPNHFLNIWVCNLENGSANSLLGYATHPGGSNTSDGVVINYKAFGRIGNYLKPQYNLGRTTTHEIGHWLDLFHVWGDDGNACSGSDFINDTPNQGGEHFGCPSFPAVSCNNGPNGDMFMNYMDYTDDKCMMLFTAGQRTRMTAALVTSRDSILLSEIYTQPLNQFANDLKILYINAPIGLNCNKKIDPVITVKNEGTSAISSFSLDYGVDDDALKSYSWTGTLVPGQITEIQLPVMTVSEDLHIFIVNAAAVNGSSDGNPLDNFKTRSFLYTPEKYGCPVYPETPEVSIYPNLANDMISISTKYKEAQKVTLSIFNVTGKKIYKQDYYDSHGETLQADVSGLAAGVYLVEIKTFNKATTQKLVIYH